MCIQLVKNPTPRQVLTDVKTTRLSPINQTYTTVLVPDSKYAAVAKSLLASQYWRCKIITTNITDDSYPIT